MTAVAIATVFGVAAFGWPFLVAPRSALADGLDAWLIFGGLLALVTVTVLTLLAEGTLDAKAVAMLGVLSAVAAAVRPLGAGTAGIEPLFFVFILGGRAFGSGFWVRTGQHVAVRLRPADRGRWALVAVPDVRDGVGRDGGPAYLPRSAGRHEVLLLAAYGFVAAFFYGLVMNLSFWPFGIGPRRWAGTSAGP